jgi:glycosyltransferase involved in cell wall biosynthesis
MLQPWKKVDEMANRKIYLEPTYKLHVGYHLRELVPYPPAGYEFVINAGTSDGLFKWISRNAFSYKLATGLYHLAPITLIKSHIGRFMNKPPEGTELTFSLNHLILRKEPWVIEIDAPWDPLGPSVRHFKKYRSVVERTFASDYCKKILFFDDFSKKTLLSLMDCSRFEQKIDILPRAVHKQEFKKKATDDKVRLLFLGSANLSGEFEMRGGKEVIEAFTFLSRKYNNIELIIRSDISPEMRERYRDCLHMENVRLIDKILPLTELETIYRSADIFLFPGHYDNWLCILEAMSYELPVIATDVYGTSERVDNGKTGLLVKSSKEVPYFDDGIPFLNLTSKFQKAIEKVDPTVVTELVGKTSFLIENKAKREDMGKAGRWEIEHGRFSIENRNKVFKTVFDEALVKPVG